MLALFLTLNSQRVKFFVLDEVFHRGGYEVFSYHLPVERPPAFSE